MQASFTDLVGTAVVPAHCFDSTDLTDLVPALATAASVYDMTAQASEARGTPWDWCPIGSPAALE